MKDSVSIYQSILNYTKYFYAGVIETYLSGCETILDLGCGYDSPLTYMKGSYDTTGVDIYKEALVESKKKGTHTRYKQYDIRMIKRAYPKKTFDAVVLFDVIEHLTRAEGEALLKDIKTMATKTIVILTPNGYTDQDAYDGNPYQKHKSGWTLQDFRSRAYRVYGMRGLQWIRGTTTRIRFKPDVLWGGIAFLSHFVCHYFPHVSYQLLAVKTVSNKHP